MEVTLYVAEDIQTLENQKLLMVGVFADRVILLNVPKGTPKPSAATPMAMSTLSLSLTVAGLPPESYTVTLSLKSPSGVEIMQDRSPREFAVTEGSALNLIVKSTPFVMVEDGLYTLSASIGDQTASGTFVVKVKELNA
jgi:hypothetical protein